MYLGFISLVGRRAAVCLNFSSRFYFAVLFHSVMYLGFISLVGQGWEGQPAPTSGGRGFWISSRLKGIGSGPASGCFRFSLGAFPEVG
jgi:hypothetical protein